MIRILFIFVLVGCYGTKNTQAVGAKTSYVVKVDDITYKCSKLSHYDAGEKILFDCQSMGYALFRKVETIYTQNSVIEVRE